MNNLKSIKLALASILLTVFAAQVSVAQTYTLNNNTSNLKIEGTSNVHDWEIEAKNQQGKLVAQLEDGNLKNIDQLEFTVISESLKSGKNGMDKNTYKALNTGKYKNITYNLTKVNKVDCSTAGNCKVNTSGNLTIAGTTRPINLIFDASVSGENVTLTGATAFKMTQYKIDPPTAVFGTIKTGDLVNIKFDACFQNNSQTAL